MKPTKAQTEVLLYARKSPIRLYATDNRRPSIKACERQGWLRWDITQFAWVLTQQGDEMLTPE